MSDERYVEFLSEVLASVLAKDVVFVLRQFGRSEPSHVFDESEDRHINLVVGVHVDAFAGIGERHLLRRADDDCTSDVESLDEGKVDVACAWRGVEDEVVELAPVGFADELLLSVASHTSAPECCLVWVDKESYREKFYSIFFDRLDEVASVNILCIRSRVLHLEHLRH